MPCTHLTVRSSTWSASWSVGERRCVSERSSSWCHGPDAAARRARSASPCASSRSSRARSCRAGSGGRRARATSAGPEPEARRRRGRASRRTRSASPTAAGTSTRRAARRDERDGLAVGQEARSPRSAGTGCARRRSPRHVDLTCVGAAKRPAGRGATRELSRGRTRLAGASARGSPPNARADRLGLALAGDHEDDLARRVEHRAASSSRAARTARGPPRARRRPARSRTSNAGLPGKIDAQCAVGAQAEQDQVERAGSSPPSSRRSCCS